MMFTRRYDKIIFVLFLLIVIFFNSCTKKVEGVDIDKRTKNTEEREHPKLTKTKDIEDKNEVKRSIKIYDGKFKIGWHIRPWNGLIVEETQGSDGKKTLYIKVSEKARPWGGVKIRSLLKINAITIDKELKDKGEFVFYVNGGEDMFGNHLGEQEIFLSLEYSPEAKKFLRIKGKKHLPKIRLQEEYIDGNKIDNNPDTWQRVAIPLNKFPMLNDFADALDTVLIQFGGVLPKSGIYINRMRVELAHNSQSPKVDKPIKELAYRTDIEFPEIEDIDPDLIMPAGYTVSVDQYGNFTVNGNPRYLIGTHTAGAMAHHWKHKPGYAGKYNWIYDRPPDYESSQRLGLDTMGLFIPPAWVRKYLPDNRRKWIEAGADAVDRFVKNIKLPLYVDLACTKRGHGMLAFTPYIPEEAKAKGKESHYLFYSVTHPEGIKLYQEFWRFSTRRLLTNGGYPLLYELFNEPAFDDDGKYNHEFFVRYLKEKYKDIEKLNNTWQSKYKSFEKIASFRKRTDNPGLFVDFGKFLEDAFTKLCRIVKNTIKEIDKREDVRVTFQPGGGDWYRAIPNRNVNPYKVNKFMDVITAGTGGGIYASYGLSKPVQSSIESVVVSRQFEEGMLMANYFRNIAGNKPILDGEFTGSGGPYRGTNRKRLKNDIWLEAVRGYNATYLFKWNRDSLLNPSKVPTDALLAIMDFKKELKIVGDLIVTRPRNVKRDIALLISYPTERISQVTGNTMHNEILTYAGALEFSHWPYDVVLEEQFPEGRLKNYKVLITAGVNNIYPESVKYIEEFIREGRTLIMGIDILGFDEYGNRINWSGIKGLTLGDKVAEGVKEVNFKYSNWRLLPGKIKGITYKEIHAKEGWQAIGSIGKRDCIYKKSHGKGNIYYIGVKMPEYPLASILGNILSKEDISRYVELTDYKRGDLCPNIEVHSANRNNKKAFYLYNWDSYSKIAYLKSKVKKREKYRAFDPISGEEYEVSDKGILLYLPPQDRKIIVLSEEEMARQKMVFVKNADIVNQYEKVRRKEEERLAQTEKRAAER